MSRNSFHLRVKQAGKMAAGRKRPILTFVTCISLDMCDENAAHYNSMSNVQPMKITIFSHKFLREQDRARGSTTGRNSNFYLCSTALFMQNFRLGTPTIASETSVECQYFGIQQLVSANKIGMQHDVWNVF